MPDVAVYRGGRRVDPHWPEPSPLPINHPGRSVGMFGSSMQCQTCFVVCQPDYQRRAWIDPDTARYLAALDAWDDIGPEPVEPSSVEHVYPFAPERVNAPNPETAQDDLGDVETPEAPTDAAPIRREAPDLGTAVLARQAMEAWENDEEAATTLYPRQTPAGYEVLTSQNAMDAVVKEEQAHARMLHRTAINPALRKARDGKSALGRTREYRRIEKRRQLARQKGLDPDALGPHYRLPRRGDTRRVSDLRRSLVKLGIFGKDELADVDLRELV
jgi:hypothetical protein